MKGACTAWDIKRCTQHTCTQTHTYVLMYCFAHAGGAERGTSILAHTAHMHTNTRAFIRT